MRPAASSRRRSWPIVIAQRLLDLGLVRRHRGHAPEAQEGEARVHGHRDPPLAREGDRGAHQGFVEEPAAVVAHQHTVHRAPEGAEGALHRPARRRCGTGAESSGRAHDLLLRGVRAAGEKARLHRRRVARLVEDALRDDPLLPEERPQPPPVLVLPDDAEGQRRAPEGADVVDGVGAAAQPDVGRVVPAGSAPAPRGSRARRGRRRTRRPPGRRARARGARGSRG